jgi:prepilin-type N-terminal cleavage/methylation domain-containing protein
MKITQPRGFTLLEMLLAAVISATLMLTLWSLFGSYMRLFETGQAKAEQSQLIRALGEQLADDLLAAVPPPAPAGPIVSARFQSSGPSANQSLAVASVSFEPPVQSSSPGSANGVLVTAGLIGTSRALKLDLVQITSNPERLPRRPQLESSGRRQQPLVAPELRSVLYTFEEPREARPGDRRPPPGLVRREIDWQTLWEKTSGDRRTDVQSTGDQTQRAIAQAIAAFGLNASLPPEERADETTTWVPEILAVEFHYFDGSQWVDEWDSRARRSLPAAVEVVWQAREFKKKSNDRQPVAVAPTVPVLGKGTSRNERKDATLNAPGAVSYRDVIVLPRSRLLQSQENTLAGGRSGRGDDAANGRFPISRDRRIRRGGRTP